MDGTAEKQWCIEALDKTPFVTKRLQLYSRKSCDCRVWNASGTAFFVANCHFLWILPESRATRK